MWIRRGGSSSVLFIPLGNVPKENEVSEAIDKKIDE